DEAAAPPLFAAAFAELEAVDREMSRQPDSPLSVLNQAGGGVVSAATGQVLAAALGWARRTQGAFDPTTAALLDLWDILAGPHPPPPLERLADARQRVGWQHLELSPDHRRVALGGTYVDLGGIAKGYAIDRAAEALRRGGARDFLVNAGGDLMVAGSKGGVPWRVGIQHPRRPEELLQVVTPAGGALVTSGDYERSYTWDGILYHHILDPRSGEPARGCQSVTVWAANAMDADALATAVFVLGPEEGLALVERETAAEALVVTAAGEVRESSGFRRVVPEATRR
ncbi:MAG TPA: FAD:protein FMN transferase, partial [Deferrisomatales bacterium]|nr:FAD:protein FMN transferase [Deferrisomatales bacterium]